MSRKKQVYEKITALYCRISLDDGGDNESMSISNQKIMLRDFAEKHGMFQYEYYVDDGYTGRNFNRPAFQRMIADIEAGKSAASSPKTYPGLVGTILKLAAISKSFSQTQCTLYRHHGRRGQPDPSGDGHYAL